MKLAFTKMHGCGNNYIYFNCFDQTVPDPESLSIKLSEPHFGIGGDGIILISPSDKADAQIRIFNADGSEGVMCGNGVRCAAEFLYTHGVRRDCIRIDTPSAGQRVLHRVGDGLWQVEMGRFTAAPDAVGAVGLGGGPLLDVPLCAGGRAWRVHCVAVGNPHCVLFTHEPPPAGAELAAWGRALGHHPAFPGGINVEFAQVLEEGKIRMRVWERGSGVTRACGTGACATAVAAFLTGRAGRKSIIGMDGGTLTIEWDIATKHVFMTGEATKVFEGEMETDEEL